MPDRDIFAERCDPIWADAARVALSCDDDPDAYRVVENALATHLHEHGGEIFVAAVPIVGGFLEVAKRDVDLARATAYEKLDRLKQNNRTPYGDQSIGIVKQVIELISIGSIAVRGAQQSELRIELLSLMIAQLADSNLVCSHSVQQISERLNQSYEAIISRKNCTVQKLRSSNFVDRLAAQLYSSPSGEKVTRSRRRKAPRSQHSLTFSHPLTK